MEKNGSKLFADFAGSDRFALPDGIVRVTASHGGESWLILGSEKTALYDCGMAFAGEALVENIRRALSGRTLDYVLLSHTHYDHLGGLPSVRKAWPEAEVFGSAHGQRVLSRPGALKFIEEMGRVSKEAYGSSIFNGSPCEVTSEGLAVTRVLREGDMIELGADKSGRGLEKIRVFEAKGHTDCSLAFLLEPAGILFPGESTGVLKDRENVHVAILKSYEDSMATAKKMRSLRAKYVICPHYGMVPPTFNEDFWDLYEKEATEEREYILSLYGKGLSGDEIVDLCAQRYWSEEETEEQPLEAFRTNMECTVRIYDPARAAD